MTKSDSELAYCIWRFNRWLAAGNETYGHIDAKVTTGEMRVGEMPCMKCTACKMVCKVHPLLSRSYCCDAEVVKPMEARDSHVQG